MEYKPGKELDAQIAKEVMGWSVWTGPCNKPIPPDQFPTFPCLFVDEKTWFLTRVPGKGTTLWTPSHHVQDAFEAAAQIGRLKLIQYTDGWYATFPMDEYGVDAAPWLATQLETPAMAICVAMIEYKAKEAYLAKVRADSEKKA